MLRHFLSADRSADPCDSLQLPVVRFARVMRTTGPENENGICRGAAPQTRGEPGPRPECGRQVTVVEKAGSQRSSRVAQFDRADQRPYAILVDCLIARNTRLMERVGKQLSKSRSHCVSTGKASRRFFRYRTRRSWSRARRVVWLPGFRGLNARSS